MKKNRIILIIISIVLIIALLLFIAIKRDFFKKTSNVLFYLEDKYYGESKITEITTDELNKLIEEKESFGIFIHQPMCSNSYAFNKVLVEYAEKNKVSFYTMAFSEMKTTALGKYVKYYPSFVIYNEGNYVDHLEADKDEDLKYYKNTKNFNEWFTKYVNLK